jgi:hypothetical protein
MNLRAMCTFQRKFQVVLKFVEHVLVACMEFFFFLVWARLSPHTISKIVVLMQTCHIHHIYSIHCKTRLIPSLES